MGQEISMATLQDGLTHFCRMLALVASAIERGNGEIVGFAARKIPRDVAGGHSHRDRAP